MKKKRYGKFLILFTAACMLLGLRMFAAPHPVWAASVGKTKLSSVQAKSSTSVQIKWLKVPKADGYYVYRKLPGSKSWTRARTITKGTSVSCTDAKVSPGVQYIYTVRAYQNSGTKKIWGSYDTKGLTVVTPPETVILSNASGSSGSVKITWKAAKGAKGYLVYRKDGSSWKRLKTITSAKTLSYTDSSSQAAPGKVYTVRAYCTYNGKNTFGNYQKAGITASEIAVTLNLKPVFDLQYYNVLRWQELKTAKSYEIWKGNSPSSLTLFLTRKSSELWPDSDQYIRYYDTTFTTGKTYYYKIKATLKNGDTVESQIRSVTPGSSITKLTPQRTAAFAWLVLDKFTYGIFSSGLEAEVSSIGLDQKGDLHFCYKNSNGATRYVTAGIHNTNVEDPTCWHSSIIDQKHGVSIYYSSLSTKPSSIPIIENLNLKEVRQLKDAFIREDCYVVVGGA